MHLVILLFALFASLFTFQKDTLQYAEPFFLVGSRMLFAGMLLVSYQWLTGRHQIKLPAKAIKGIVLLGLANIYLTNIFEIWGLSHMVSSKACLLYSLSPFLAALVAFIVLKEKLNPRKWAGMLIGFFGLWPILYTQTGTELSSGQWAIFSLAELSVLGAVLCSVYGWILLKKVLSEHQLSPMTANGYSMTLGGILALCHSYVMGEHWDPVPVMQVSPFVINQLCMCLISNIVCYNLYGFLLKRYSATFMSFAGLVTPLFASLFGWFFLQETVTWHFFASIFLFSFGLVIFYQEEIKQQKQETLGLKQNARASAS